MVKAMLFDYGGTLDTAARHWYYVIREAYEHTGLHLADEDLRAAYVFGERALARTPIIQPEDDFRTLLVKKIDLEMQNLEECGLVEADFSRRQQLVDNIAAYCDDYARRTVLSARDVLDAMCRKYRLIMVSNFYGNLQSVLSAYGVASYFEQIVESAVVGVRKPDPAIWRLGVEAAGCLPEECVAVGDSFSKDMVPAQSAGCQTVWFKGEEWEPKAYDESLPTHVITALSELGNFY